MIFALPKKTKTIYKLRFLSVVLAVLSVLLCFFERNELVRMAFYIVFALSIVGYWALYGFLKTYRLKISSGGIIVFYKVFVSVKKICPIGAISYITRVKTPIAKKNRLCAILLKTAPKSIIIPEMFETTVLKLQKCIGVYDEEGD